MHHLPSAIPRTKCAAGTDALCCLESYTRKNNLGVFCAETGLDFRCVVPHPKVKSCYNYHMLNVLAMCQRRGISRFDTNHPCSPCSSWGSPWASSWKPRIEIWKYYYGSFPLLITPTLWTTAVLKLSYFVTPAGNKVNRACGGMQPPQPNNLCVRETTLIWIWIDLLSIRL